MVTKRKHRRPVCRFDDTRFYNKPAPVTHCSVISFPSGPQPGEAKVSAVKFYAVPSRILTNINTEDPVAKVDTATGRLENR